MLQAKCAIITASHATIYIRPGRASHRHAQTQGQQQIGRLSDGRAPCRRVLPRFPLFFGKLLSRTNRADFADRRLKPPGVETSHTVSPSNHGQKNFFVQKIGCYNDEQCQRN
jgi:hypothetical protein